MEGYDVKYEIHRGAGWLDEDGKISNYGIEENVKSVKDCEEACNSLRWPECVGFTYVSSENRCDLKNHDNAASLKKGYASSIISGEVECRGFRYDHESKWRFYSTEKMITTTAHPVYTVNILMITI